MKIKVIASSAKGNAYLVSDGETKLLLECGVSIKEIQRAVNFEMSTISACLISHEHKDHSLSAKELINRGVNVYASTGTLEALDCKESANIVKAKKTYKINTFYITPFDLIHDANEPLGFLIVSVKTRKRLVFITDTAYCKYKFNNLTHIMIECNYSSDSKKGYKEDRVYKTHMGLKTCIGFLLANNLSKVEEILLIHLSDTSADAKLILSEVQKVTGKYVKIAQR